MINLKKYMTSLFPELISIQNNNFICGNNFMSLISIQNNVLYLCGYNFLFDVKDEFSIYCNKYTNKK